MKKKITILLLGIMFMMSSVIRAEGIFREDWVWKYRANTVTRDRSTRPHEELYAYDFDMKFDGSTEIDGTVWHNFRTVGARATKYERNPVDESSYFWQYVPKGTVDIEGGATFLVREEEGRYYMRLPEGDNKGFCYDSWWIPESPEVLIYDFNCGAGDSFRTFGADGARQTLSVRSTSTIEVAGQSLKVMETTSGSDFDYPVVEGIGFVDKGVLPFGNFDLKLESVWEDFRTVFPGASRCQYLTAVEDLDGNVVFTPGMLKDDNDSGDIFDEDLVWTYRVTNAPSHTYYYKMKFDGTTDIDGTTWHNFKNVKAYYLDFSVSRENPDTVPMPTGDTFLIRGENRRYYVRLPKEGSGLRIPDVYWCCDGEEALLCDYNCEPGESFSGIVSLVGTGAPLCTPPGSVLTVEYVKIDGRERKVVTTDMILHAIEGFGSIFGTMAYSDRSATAGRLEHDPTSLPAPEFNEELVDVRKSDGTIIFFPNMLYGEKPGDDYYTNGWVWKYSVPEYDILPDGRKIAYHFWMKYTGWYIDGGRIWHPFTTVRATASEVVQVSGTEVEERNTVELPAGRTFLICREGDRFFVNRQYWNKTEAFLPDSWWHIADTGTMLYDFGCGAGEMFSTLTNAGEAVRLAVDSVSTIDIAGKECRVQYVDGVPVVEGIGFVRNGALPFFSMSVTDAEQTDDAGIRQYWPSTDAIQNLECVEDAEGNVIFTPSMVNGGNAVEGVSADTLTLRKEGNFIWAVSDAEAAMTLEVVGIEGAKHVAAAGRGTVAADLSTLAPGIYVVRATDGRDVKTLKVMINDK